MPDTTLCKKCSEPFAGVHPGKLCPACEPMTSTDLAHALAVPLRTPGCWALNKTMCGAGPCSELGCLWPLPDSGKPGAELWCYWLMRALGVKAERVLDEYFQVLREWPDMVREKPLQAALYAAWQEREGKHDTR